MTELSQIDLDKYKHNLEDLTVIYEDKDIDTIIEDFKKQYKVVSSRPDAEGRSVQKLMDKARNMLIAIYASGDNREKFEAIIFGFRTPQNNNADEMQLIKDLWAKGPRQRKKLLEEGKIMTMDEDVPISTIDFNPEFTDEGEMIPHGKVWEEGEEIIPREYKKVFDDNKTKNWNWSYPMKDNWKLDYYGYAESISDGIKRSFNHTLYGDLADPSHPDFLPEQTEEFSLYDARFYVNEDRTEEDNWVFKGEPSFSPKESIKLIDDILYELDEEGIVSLVPVGFIREFHDNEVAVKDEDGNIIKTKSGYDKTNWNKYGMGIYQVTSASKTKKGNYRLDIMDSSAPKIKISAFTEPHIEIGFNAPAECIICWRSTKRPDRYDREQKKRIIDPVNGDINLNIMGLKCLMTYAGSIEDTKK